MNSRCCFSAFVCLVIAAGAHAQGHSRSLPPLPSRSSGRSAARASQHVSKTVSARVGRVSARKAEIRAARNLKSPLLFSIPEGTNLAVLAEAGDFYGVLMVNETLGWISKSALEIVPGYETKVTLRKPLAQAPVTPRAESSQDAHLDFRQASPQIQEMLRHAFGWSGVRYIYGGESRTGVDCSAFVRDCYRQLGIELPRVAADQAQSGQAVEWSDLKPGDRLYFDMKHEGRIGHCGLYIGNGYFIHASSNQHQVGIDSLFKSNYYRSLVCARRG